MAAGSLISQTAEYALRAVVCLAQHGGEACTTQVVAEESHLPQGYLAKVMQSLTRAGILQSKRGLHGGFTLMRPPAEISIFDVIDAVDPIKPYETCPLELPWHCEKLCPLHRSLDDMITSFIEQSKQTTIGDILPKNEPKPPQRRRSPEEAPPRGRRRASR
jgi:Rrf2 family transcriptional regulator, nitric oxide-sensitive transcriptional repressor